MGGVLPQEGEDEKDPLQKRHRKAVTAAEELRFRKARMDAERARAEAFLLAASVQFRREHEAGELGERVGNRGVVAARGDRVREIETKWPVCERADRNDARAIPARPFRRVQQRQQA